MWDITPETILDPRSQYGMDPITYVKESCEMQFAVEPEDFIRMAFAYRDAVSFHDADGYFGVRNPVNCAAMIETFAMRINGVLGQHKFRDQPATFMTLDSAVSADQVPRLMTQLCNAVPNLSADDFYQEFERIHPFPDGNGRIGSLMYNMLKGTIPYPVHPPMYTGKVSLDQPAKLVALDD